MIPRIFIDADKIQNDIVTIDGGDFNYLKNVMRLKIGDEIAVLGNNREFEAKIISLDKNSAKARFLAEKQPKSELKVRVTIAQCLPKNPKMDTIIQKATELGAFRMIPVISERSIVKVPESKEKTKIERWRKIVKEAAEQSGRTVIPVIDDIKYYKNAVENSKGHDGRIMLWETEKEMTLKKFLQENKKISSLFILIGPEGGFSQEEAAFAKKNGFTTVSIGNRILRTETAAPAVLSMINYEFEL